MNDPLLDYARQIGALPPDTTTNAVDERKPQPFEWALVDAAATWTDNVEAIAAMSDAPIIQGLLREAEVVQIVGAAKTAKTWFTLRLALSVAAGEAFLERETLRRKVLYLDYELKPGTFCKRLSMLSPARPEGFHYQCLRGLTRLPTLAEITALVKQEAFGLVVVDSLYRTGWLSEENNNDSTSRELAALQTFAIDTRATMICVDHTAKGGGAERSAVDASRGASSKGGFFDSILVLRATDKGPEKTGTYVSLDPVLRDWPRLGALPLIAFRWTGHSACLEVVGEVSKDDAHPSMARLLDHVAGAPEGIGRHQLEKITGQSEATLRRMLDRLVIQGKLVEFPDPSHRQRKLYRTVDLADAPIEPPISG